MLLNNIQLENAIESLKELYTKPLPVKASFVVASLTRNIAKQYELFDSEKSKLIEKWAVKDTVGQLVRPVKPDGSSENNKVIISDVQSYNTELTQLYACTTDIPVQQLTIEELGDIEISPSTINKLDWLFGL